MNVYVYPPARIAHLIKKKVHYSDESVYQSCAAGPRGVVFGSQALIFGPAVS